MVADNRDRLGDLRIEADGVELTIAVCTYRRFDELRACLQNIERQTIDRARFRVLVIDNSLSPDESAAFRDSLNLDYAFEYVITRKNGIAYARNEAIRLCRTPYLGYVDDDVFIADDWAEVLLDTFARHDGRAGCVSGKIKPRFEAGEAPSWLKDELLWPLAVIDWGDKEKLLIGESEWFVTASIGFDIRAIRLAGGFSEDLGRKGKILLAHEDLQIVTNLRRMGFGIVYNPGFYAEHSIPESRTTQQWYCRDAFWQTVSRLVYASGKPFDLDGPLVGELTKAVEKHETAWRDQPDKEHVQAKLAVVAADARKLMKRHGYDPSKHFPDPEFRTIYLVTPSHNAADTIEETMRSVFSQEGAVFIRYHVQDGGSTDGTLDILEEWGRRVRENDLPFPVECAGIHMTWTSSPDGSVYEAINKGFSFLPLESADVMGWLNADDLLNTGALSVINKVFDIVDVQWAVGMTSVLQEGRATEPYLYVYPRNLIKSGLCDGYYWKHIQQEGSFWRKGLWDAAGGLNQSLKRAGDWDLWRRFAEHAEPAHVDRATGCFRLRAGQLSSNVDAYNEEVNGIVPQADRRFAAAALAADSTDTWFQRYDTMTGKRFVEQLAPAHLPKQAYENYRDFSRPFFAAPAAAPSAGASGGIRKQGALLGRLPTSAGPLGRLVRRYRHARERRAIAKSGLFLRRFYLDAYPDVAEADLDPLDHFIAYGAAEGRSPNPFFCESYYRNNYPDVAEASATTGLTHYIRTGWRERRDPHPDFSTSFYLSSNPDVEMTGVNPLSHYLLHGIPEGRIGRWRKGEDPARRVRPAPGGAMIRVGGRRSAADSGAGVDGASSAAVAWLADKPYSRRCDWSELGGAAQALIGAAPDPADSDLGVYQDLFVLEFIRRFIPKGSRVLEVGGGASRILPLLAEGYECWSLDRSAGDGEGAPLADEILRVCAYIGDFSRDMPERHFDVIYSVSLLEQFPDGDVGFYRAALEDIERLAAGGCVNLHLVDVIAKPERNYVWACGALRHWLAAVKRRSWRLYERAMLADDDLFVMSEPQYEKSWRPATGQSYAEFGAPASFNLFWASVANDVDDITNGARG